MTKLEEGARRLIDHFTKIWKPPGEFSKKSIRASGWLKDYVESLCTIIDAIEEIDSRKTATDCMCSKFVRGELGEVDHNDIICSIKSSKKSIESKSSVTDTQRRMGLRDTRHVSATPWDSDYD